MVQHEKLRTGGCLCGRVRYRVEGDPGWIANCHCASCRRATGSPMTTYAGFPRGSLVFESGEPRRFHSSPGVTRSFCGDCGTPLTYEGERWPDEVHVLVATFDQPENYPPESDAFAEERLPWMPLGTAG
jgi:hypothetical protein